MLAMIIVSVCDQYCFFLTSVIDFEYREDPISPEVRNIFNSYDLAEQFLIQYLVKSN